MVPTDEPPMVKLERESEGDKEKILVDGSIFLILCLYLRLDVPYIAFRFSSRWNDH